MTLWVLEWSQRLWMNCRRTGQTHSLPPNEQLRCVRKNLRRGIQKPGLKSLVCFWLAVQIWARTGTSLTLCLLISPISIMRTGSLGCLHGLAITYTALVLIPSSMSSSTSWLLNNHYFPAHKEGWRWVRTPSPDKEAGLFLSP